MDKNLMQHNICTPPKKCRLSRCCPPPEPIWSTSLGGSPCTAGWLAPPSPGVCHSPSTGHSPACSGQLLWRFSMTDQSSEYQKQRKDDLLNQVSIHVKSKTLKKIPRYNYTSSWWQDFLSEEKRYITKYINSFSEWKERKAKIVNKSVIVCK